MSDEIKTNDIVEETVETEVPETEEVTEIDTAETTDSKKKAKKDAVFKINPKTGKKRLRGWLITLITIVTIIAVGTASVFIALEALSGGGTDSTLADAPLTFGDSIAANWGAGLRLDFGFLLLRLDMGMRVHDPARAEKWVKPSQWIKRDGYALHFGVGYPF